MKLLHTYNKMNEMLMKFYTCVYPCNYWPDQDTDTLLQLQSLA